MPKPTMFTKDQKFDRLKIISLVGSRPGVGRVWLVECRCGRRLEVPASRLTSGKTRSCGCLQRDHAKTFRRKHGACSGYSQTPEHYVWQAMIQRCTNENHKQYKHYGERGITVCERWLPDNGGFANFLADMGKRPSKRHTLERRENDLGYSPTNCAWATWKQQGANKRNSRKLTYKGRTEVCSEWARITGISQKTVLNRMNAGKSPAEVLYPWSESN